jgi:hypothetical protein
VAFSTADLVVSEEELVCPVIAVGSTEASDASWVSVAIAAKAAGETVAELESAESLEPDTLARGAVAESADTGADAAPCDAATEPAAARACVDCVTAAAVAASVSAVVDFEAAVSEVAESVPPVASSDGEDDLAPVESTVPRAVGAKTVTRPVGGTSGWFAVLMAVAAPFALREVSDAD